MSAKKSTKEIDLEIEKSKERQTNKMYDFLISVITPLSEGLGMLLSKVYIPLLGWALYLSVDSISVYGFDVKALIDADIAVDLGENPILLTFKSILYIIGAPTLYGFVISLYAISQKRAKEAAYTTIGEKEKLIESGWANRSSSGMNSKGQPKN